MNRIATPIKKAYFKGLNKVFKPHAGTSSSPFYPFYTASQLASIYKFPKPDTSISNTIGVMSFGGGLFGRIDPATGILTGGDVQKYWKYQNIPDSQMPAVIVYPVGGTKNNLNDQDGTVENTMDISVIGSCCPNPKLTIVLFIFPQAYTMTRCFQIMINGISVAGKAYKPSIISISWGASEIAFLRNGKDVSGDLTGVNNLLASATKKGLNICVAAGDYGSTNNNGTSALSTDFPSSCPYVTAVGGTALQCPSGSYDSSTVETVWNDGVINGVLTATGGGVSAFYPKPVYQKNITGTKGSMRNVPDIAFVADPDTGLVMFFNGILYAGFGGTSMSAPMFAGYLAAINAKTFANPLLYSATTECFHDITVGNNYNPADQTQITSYIAGKGYDCCSGLGSIDGNVMSPFIATKQPAAPLPVKASAITLSPYITNLNLTTNKTATLVATISPSNTTNKTINWKSSNTNVINVNLYTGLITAVGVGRAYVGGFMMDGSNKYNLAFVNVANIDKKPKLIFSNTNANANTNTYAKPTNAITPFKLRLVFR